MNNNVGSNLGNAIGGMVKAMTDLADHYEGVANEVGKSDAEHWADYKRENSGAAPPYALPPFVFYIPGPEMNPRRVDAEARATYKLRSPWGFLINEVFRSMPSNTPLEDVATVRSGPSMNARMFASHAVDQRIALEEQVDFPNNLTTEDRARIKALDPTGEKTARARAQQAANIAAKQSTFDEYAEERARIRDATAAERLRIRDAVLEKVSDDPRTRRAANEQSALDRILRADIDLFQTLFGTMMELAEDSKVTFTPKDLKSLWNEIMDAVDKLGDQLLGPQLGLLPDVTRKTLLDQWTALIKATREAGHLAINKPHKVNDGATPEGAKTAWDALLGVLNTSEYDSVLLARTDTVLKDHKLIVFYDYSGYVGHFFLELETNNKESFYFGKYPQRTFDEAGRDKVSFAERVQEEGIGRAIQATIRDIALVIHGPGSIVTVDDDRLMRKYASDAKATSIENIVGDNNQIVMGEKHVPLTKSEFNLIKKKLEKRKLGPQDYVLVRDNCATFVEYALGGITTLEEMFPVEVLRKSAAGLYVISFPENPNGEN